jgi:hypothetical protein
LKIIIYYLLLLKLKSLDGLSKFIAMGTLNMYGNDLNWTELEKIRHLHIIDINLLNNPRLEKDPNCIIFLRKILFSKIYLN